MLSPLHFYLLLASFDCNVFYLLTGASPASSISLLACIILRVCCCASLVFNSTFGRLFVFIYCAESSAEALSFSYTSAFILDSILVSLLYRQDCLSTWTSASSMASGLGASALHYKSLHSLPIPKKIGSWSWGSSIQNICLISKPWLLPSISNACDTILNFGNLLHFIVITFLQHHWNIMAC